MTDVTGEEGAALPELVFIPAHPLTRQGTREVGLELRRSQDGRPVLPAFTTLSRLVSALGPYQPWVRMPLRAARALIGSAGADEVLLNPTTTDEQTRWTQADVRALQGGTSP